MTALAIKAPSWRPVVARVELRLPLPPSTNNLFRNVPGRGRVRTSDYRSWLTVAGSELLIQRPGHVAGDVVVDVRVPRGSRRRDLDNFGKALCDLLVRHAVIEDDSRVGDYRVRWGEEAACVVAVTPLAGGVPR